MRTKSGKEVELISEPSLYNWAQNFKRLQEKFFTEPVKLKRIEVIESISNGYQRIYHMHDVDLELDVPKERFTNTLIDADLILMTDQRISRWSCNNIINTVKGVNHFADVLLCLNRHYLNIDNANIKSIHYHSDYLTQIRYWIADSFPAMFDLSEYYLDCGEHFTWVVPDRIFYIPKKTV